MSATMKLVVKSHVARDLIQSAGLTVNGEVRVSIGESRQRLPDGVVGIEHAFCR
jgi:hypothetical protein